MTLPTCDTLLLDLKDSTLSLILNRPKARNAMSVAMVSELNLVCEWLETNPSVRAVVLRGSDGHFCAGGDIRDMAQARAKVLGNESADSDPYYDLNRAFGTMIERVEKLPQVVVALLEGAVLGGGFGLASVCDIGIVDSSARLGMPETTLGLIPAQIAPFVVRRMGLTQARRLALLGLQVDGAEAVQLGLAHHVVSGSEAMAECLEGVLASIRRCAPGANAKTKALMLAVGEETLCDVLDTAAELFSQAVRDSEGVEGTMAFIEKRAPSWATGAGS